MAKDDKTTGSMLPEDAAPVQPPIAPLIVRANATILGGTPAAPKTLAVKGERFELDSADPDNWLARGFVSIVPSVDAEEGVSVQQSAGANITQAG